MKQVLERLMELQRLDLRQMQLENLKGDLPNQVKRLQAEMNKAQQAAQEQSDKLRAYEKERGMLEMDIKALEGRQKIYQNQLFQVKNNREYDAVTMEIESTKADIVRKENHMLEVMEAIDTTRKSAQVLKEEVEKLKGQFENKKAELEGRLEKTKKDEENLKADRIKLTAQIDIKLLSAYERIRNAKSGLGLVTVVHNACGGCHKRLPPQKVLEIREMDRLYFCDTCGRMLVWDEKISEAAL